MRRMVFPPVVLACCLIVVCFGCSRGGQVDGVRIALSQPLRMDAAVVEPRIYVDVVDDARVTSDLQSLLAALLRSDAGARPVDDPGDADYVVRVQVTEAARIDGAGASAREGSGAVLFGPLAGVAVGGAAGGGRAGVGIGLSLGMGADLTPQADAVSVWSMIAVVRITRKAPPEKIWETRATATVDGVNLNREGALRALEQGVAREIVRAFTAEAP